MTLSNSTLGDAFNCMLLAVNKGTLLLLDLFDLNSHETKPLGIVKAGS